MSYILQSIYMTILNPVSLLTGRIKETTRDRCSFVIALLIFLYLTFYRCTVYDSQIKEFLPTQFEKHVFGSVLLILLLLLSVNQPLTRVKWRKSVLIPQLLLGAGLVITGFHHPIGAGYQLTGFLLVFLFPCFYFVWNNRGDYDRLFTILCYAMIAANMVLFLLTIYYALQGQLVMEGARVAGIMNNSNGYSLVGLEFVLGSLYLLLSHQRKLIPAIVLYSIAGIGLGMMLTGQMRIAIIVLFLCAISTIVFSLRNRVVFNHRRVMVNLIVGAFFILQGLLLSFALVQINYAVIASNTETPQVTTEQVTTPQETPSIVDRFDTEGQDVNSFSSGRITIWENYARDLNLLGHNRDEYNVVEMTGIKYPFAHNVFLEVGYRCGIPLGVLSVIMILIPGLLALRYLFITRNGNYYLLFPIFAIIAYALEALLDCAFLPFIQAEAFCYYLALAVLIDTRT